MEPVWYCLSFGTLVTGVVAFSPFCRRRSSPQQKSPASISQREVFTGMDRDRVNSAFRQWADVRAEADMQYLKPQPQPEVPPAPEVNVRTIIVDPLPEPAPKTEAVPPVEETNTSVAEANPFLDIDFQGSPNFYEILQISPRADLDTIHRVYRIMAARFHPDNPVSGDHEQFIQLQEAYDVLSKPERRAQYDIALQMRETRPLPIFGTRIFVDGLDGERNRRFGVLALLYQRKRLNQGSHGISLLELERRMSLPREHLDFTLWYLRAKGFVHVLEDNSDFAITALGVDHVEANSSKNQIVRDVLTAAAPGSPAAARNMPTVTPVTTKKGKRNKENRRARRQGPDAIVAA